MSQVSEPQSTKFSVSARNRLADYLSRHGEPVELFALTPDASTREYFRIKWKGSSAVAAVYAEPFDPTTQPFLDVTRLFLEAGIPVPDLFAIDGEVGIIIQEDLGDRQLKDIVAGSTQEEIRAFQEKAITLIAKIQAATQRAYELDSISSRLAFDEEKLSWELDFFFRHHFDSLRCGFLSVEDQDELKRELSEIAVELAARPRVLCHRDYHVANIMVDQGGQLRIVDYQDARMGPASYDLVSLLLDRCLEPPSLTTISKQRLLFLDDRRRLGLPIIDSDEFEREFWLMTIQRGLKAIGTFSFQTCAGRGKVYGRFIDPTFKVVSHASEWLDRFPVIQRIVAKCLKDPITWDQD
jgi:N-acetylmuramate 1-kinase